MVACNCMGPQGNDPVCPCRMKNVVIEGGLYVEKHIVGRVPEEIQDSFGVFTPSQALGGLWSEILRRRVGYSVS